jgi:hypothetical protein
MDPDPTPDLTSSFSDFKDAKINFFSDFKDAKKKFLLFFFNLPTGTLPLVLKT